MSYLSILLISYGWSTKQNKHSLNNENFQKENMLVHPMTILNVCFAIVLKNSEGCYKNFIGVIEKFQRGSSRFLEGWYINFRGCSKILGGLLQKFHQGAIIFSEWVLPNFQRGCYK